MEKANSIITKNKYTACHDIFKTKIIKLQRIGDWLAYYVYLTTPNLYVTQNFRTGLHTSLFTTHRDSEYKTISDIIMRTLSPLNFFKSDMLDFLRQYYIV